MRTALMNIHRVQKSEPVFIFEYLSQKQTEFNNPLQSESWMNLKYVMLNLSTLPEKCHRATLWNADFFTC